MCTLAVYHRTLPQLPLVVAANRDEYLDRPAAAPAKLLDEPLAFGGRDLKAGGTWLGLNANGVIAALLNRRSSELADGSRRSRGLLCLAALAQKSVRAAVDVLERTDAGVYNPFNLLIVSEEQAAVISGDGRVAAVTWLAPGLHLLTNLDVDDPTCPRIGQSFRRFGAAGEAFAASGNREALKGSLHRILADHEIPPDPRSRGPLDALCVHAGSYGTRSSSIIFARPDHGGFEYFHAPGPPCQAQFSCIPLPF